MTISNQEIIMMLEEMGYSKQCKEIIKGRSIEVNSYSENSSIYCISLQYGNNTKISFALKNDFKLNHLQDLVKSLEDIIKTEVFEMFYGYGTIRYDFSFRYETIVVGPIWFVFDSYEPRPDFDNLDIYQRLIISDEGVFFPFKELRKLSQ